MKQTEQLPVAPEPEDTGWQGTTGFPDRDELGDDWT
jgi:hypothetical protein